jgi:hypothetical protein
VPIPILPGTNLSFVTERGVWSDQFGEIASIDWTADLGVAEVSRPFNRGFGIAIGGLEVNQPQTAWGIRLGSDPLLSNTGLPLNPAVPYLHYLDNRSFSASFGGASVSSSEGFSAGIFVDPADSIFISAKANGLADFAAGVSAAGLIPYTPAARPSHFSAEVYGNIYAKLGVDVSAFSPGTPISIAGDVTIDLDSNDDGKNFGGAKLNVNQLLARGFNTDYLGKQVTRVFRDVDIAVNGNVELGYSKAGFDFSVPVGNGSLIYRAKQGALFARGRSVNPFEGTPLATLGSRNALNIDGYAYRTGMFRLTADGTYTAGAYTMKGKVTLHNNGLFAEGRMTALGTNVDVVGKILTNGDFSFGGKAAAVFGPINGRGVFTFANRNGRVTLGADLSSGFSADVGPVYVAGDIRANISIGVGRGGLTYSGNGSASLTVGAVTIGPDISINNRELAFRVRVTPIVDEWVRITLPG